MGSTVSTRSAVGTFVSEGKQFFLLWEETYEKNCYPHTPSWSCTHLGDLESSMRKIFRHAAGCEGGGLQGKGGWMTPEGYIQRWVNLMDEPLEVDDLNITITRGRSFMNAFNEGDEHNQVLKNLREKVGRKDIVDALLNGDRVTLSLHHDANELAWMVEHGISPWRLIQNPPHGVLNQALGVPRKPSNAPNLPMPRMVRLGDDIFVQDEQGIYRYASRDYTVVAEYVCNYADIELRHRGSYRKAIKDFREAVRQAPKASDMGLHLVIDIDMPLTWNADRRQGLVDKLGDIRAPIDQVFTKLSANDLFFLGAEYVTLVDESPARGTTQADLFAA